VGVPVRGQQVPGPAGGLLVQRALAHAEVGEVHAARVHEPVDVVVRGDEQRGRVAEGLVVEQEARIDVPVGRDDRLVLLELVEAARDLAGGGGRGQESVGVRDEGAVAPASSLATFRESVGRLSRVAGESALHQTDRRPSKRPGTASGAPPQGVSRGPVLPRGTSRTGSEPSTGVRWAEGFSMRRMRRSTAARPWARLGLTMVVSPPPTSRESWMSSCPITDSSSGTRMPARRAETRKPKATRSL